MNKIRIFLDMDGTLFKWNDVPYYERLYEKGYFENLEPHRNVVEAIRYLILNADSQIEFYTLSKYLSDSPYALNEKNRSLDKYMPEIERNHRIFVPMNDSKSDYIPDGIHISDLILDDYTPNLNEWRDAGGTGVKLINGINDTHRSWSGLRIDAGLDPILFSYQLKYYAVSSLSLENRGISGRIEQIRQINETKQSESRGIYRTIKLEKGGR